MDQIQTFEYTSYCEILTASQVSKAYLLHMLKALKSFYTQKLSVWLSFFYHSESFGILLGFSILFGFISKVYIGRIWEERSSPAKGDFLEDSWYFNFPKLEFVSDICIIFISSSFNFYFQLLTSLILLFFCFDSKIGENNMNFAKALKSSKKNFSWFFPRSLKIFFFQFFLLNEFFYRFYEKAIFKIWFHKKKSKGQMYVLQGNIINESWQ